MKTKILETTLRDGSYAIDFQFTAADTAAISSALEKAGFELIELGHGLGLRASACGYGQAAETDEGYLKAAADSLKKAKWGMFCIPGIAKLEDVDMAAEHGMGFIRVGTNVTEVASSAKFVERAKKRGMFVSANFMKSYAMAPREFGQTAKLTQRYGSDVLCVVDSAGGMLASELRAYFKAVRDACDIPLAFHGHDNLGLAVSHSLLAMELGAGIIDSSLQGLGRSAGNAPTEVLLSVLERMGHETGVDLVEAMDIGEKRIRPLIRKLGRSSLDVVTGLAQFHSSHMGVIRKFATQYRVDPRRLIIGVCEKDKVHAPPALVESVAKKLARKQPAAFTARYAFDECAGPQGRAVPGRSAFSFPEGGGPQRR